MSGKESPDYKILYNPVWMQLQCCNFPDDRSESLLHHGRFCALPCRLPVSEAGKYVLMPGNPVHREINQRQ